MIFWGEVERGVRMIFGFLICRDWLDDCVIFCYREYCERGSIARGGVFREGEYYERGSIVRGRLRRALRVVKIMSLFWENIDEIFRI